MQDDWSGKLALLESAPLADCKVAVFGFGDASSFGDSFVNGIADLAAAAEKAGATLIGSWSAAGYTHSNSTAQRGDSFIGLALDNDNEAGQTAKRIDDWCEQLKSAL